MSYMDQRVSSSTHPSSNRDNDNSSEGSDEYEIVDPSPKRSRHSRSPRDSPPETSYSFYSKRMEREYDIVNFPIPEHCVGLVIGKGGSEVNAIHEKTGCRLQVHTEPSPTGFRMVEIHGPRNKIDMAKDCITQVVSRVNRAHPGPHSHGNSFNNSHNNSNRNSHGNSHNQFRPERDLPKQTVIMSIPPRKVGSLIGKGGESLRKLRSFTNCNIQLIQEGAAPNNAKPLKITGDPESVARAQRVVADFLAGNENFSSLDFAGPGNDIAPTMTMTLHVKVPRSTVGAIMGENGRTVKDLSEKTGTKIQFLPDEDQKGMDRMLAIVGTRHSVHLAATFIKDIVEACTKGITESVALFYLDVPVSKCGLVIGKGGETIKQINAESGAYCELYREGQPNNEFKTFVMKGTETQVEHAKHLIFIKVGDIPQNTPFVPSASQQQIQHPSLMQQHMPMQQMQAQNQMQQHFPIQPQMQAQIQAQCQLQMQAQMQAQHQMQARSPQQNTLNNVQLWTGQPIIQNQNPNHPQTQLLQQQIQQRQAQQQQLQQQQIQQQQLHQQQLQQLQQHQQLQQQQQSFQPQQVIAHSGQPTYNQPNIQGQYQQQPNIPGWQRLLSQQPNHSIAVQSGPGVRSQQFSPQQRMPNQQQYPRPYQPQPQLRHSPHQPHHFAPPPTLAQAPYEQSSSAYSQHFSQMKKQNDRDDREPAEGHSPRKEPEKSKIDAAEEMPDYSEQWYQYYLSINDQENAENVRIRIEEMKAEKAQKAAAVAISQASSSHSRR